MKNFDSGFIPALSGIKEFAGARILVLPELFDALILRTKLVDLTFEPDESLWKKGLCLHKRCYYAHYAHTRVFTPPIPHTFTLPNYFSCEAR